MNGRSLLSVIAVIGVIFGLVFLIFPQAIMSLYALDTDDVGYLMASFFGGSLVAFSIMLWLARKFKDQDIRRQVVLVLFISLILGTILSFWGWSYGIGNIIGLIPAILFLLGVLAAGYLLYINPKSL
jgi:hypothetical protein